MRCVAIFSEFGIIIAKGIGRIDELLKLAEVDTTLPDAAKTAIEKAIGDLEARFWRKSRQGPPLPLRPHRHANGQDRRLAHDPAPRPPATRTVTAFFDDPERERLIGW